MAAWSLLANNKKSSVYVKRSNKQAHRIVCVSVWELTCCHVHAWSRHALDWLQLSTRGVITSDVISEWINN
jgi:hypothetical protein